MKNKILQLLDKATNEELLMSRFDCHILGLHSIVLENRNGVLTRCFLANVNHEMHRNLNIDSMLLSLGAHTHRYEIEIQGVTGAAVNVKMEETQRIPPNCSRYVFRDSANFEKAGESSLVVSSMQPIEKNSSVYMAHNEIHTVYIPKGSKASWIVYEGDKVCGKTSLFTSLPVHCESYINPRSAQEVRDYVVNFYP